MIRKKERLTRDAAVGAGVHRDIAEDQGVIQEGDVIDLIREVDLGGDTAQGQEVEAVVGTIAILQGHIVVHIHVQEAFLEENIRVVVVGRQATKENLLTSQKVETEGGHRHVRGQEIVESIQAVLHHQVQAQVLVLAIVDLAQVHLRKGVTKRNQFQKKNHQLERRELLQVQKR